MFRLYDLTRSRRAVWWLTVLFVLLDCAIAFADDDHSFWRGGGGSRGGSGGGSSGPMSAELFLQGALFLGVAFSVSCAAVFALSVWLLSSLKAVKILAVLSLLPFLAWPLFIVGIIPPLPVFTLGAAYCSDLWPKDPYGALLLILLLALAAFLYFYMLSLILSVFSGNGRQRRLARAATILAVVGAAGGSIYLKSLLPLLIFAMLAVSAHLGCAAHRKVQEFARRRAERRRQ